ncbi:hypothetical protein [Marinobacterium lutimaris]|uniref:hypothetical protein n=1 Tax=Marinobacterium lutimaris TaxID=568106 RepID=UPI0011B00E59|nr:hypothetical protein [Marinobacterium lutimaris]
MAVREAAYKKRIQDELSVRQSSHFLFLGRAVRRLLPPVCSYPISSPVGMAALRFVIYAVSYVGPGARENQGTQ